MHRNQTQLGENTLIGFVITPQNREMGNNISTENKM